MLRIRVARLDAQVAQSDTVATPDGLFAAADSPLIESDGIVYGTERMVPGRVIVAGETMMYVARGQGDLVVRARVNPADIDAVTAGGEVRVQLDGLDAQSAPEISGVTTYISPEAQVDPQTGHGILRRHSDAGSEPAG